MKQRSRTSTVPSCTSSPRYSTELIFVLQSVFGLILIRSLILSLIFKKNCVTTEPQSTQTSSSKHTSSTGIYVLFLQNDLSNRNHVIQMDKQIELSLYELLAAYPLYSSANKNHTLLVPSTLNELNRETLFSYLMKSHFDIVFYFPATYFSESVCESIHTPNELPLFHYHLTNSKFNFGDLFFQVTPSQAFLLMFLYYFTSPKANTYIA